MPSFFAEVQLFNIVYYPFSKPCAKLHQLLYPAGAVFYHQFNNILVAQACASPHGILYMGIKTILCTQDRCYASLGIECGGFPLLPLGNNRDSSKSCRL